MATAGRHLAAMPEQQLEPAEWAPRRRTPGRDRAVYDLLMLRHRGAALPLAEARAAVDAAHGTTDIVALRNAALLEAQAALEIAVRLPPPDLIDEDDLEDP